MPQRPFASNSSARGASPAGSSTGDSSSGRAPFTPRDGSEIGVRSKDDASDVGSTVKARGHAKKPSVTFEDEPSRERAKTDLTHEQRTRERRRSEAKAALEVRFVSFVWTHRLNLVITLARQDRQRPRTAGT